MILTNKFDKYKIPKKTETMEKYCYPTSYKHQIPQKFLAELINPKSSIKGILLYHGIGSGKTCASIGIAENFKNLKKIIIVLPAALESGYRGELRSECAGNNYLTQSERDRLKTLSPASQEYAEIIQKSDKRINKYYTIYSYNKFIELIKTDGINLKNTILIIDEIHNMISEKGTYYKLLYKTIHPIDKSSKIIIMTATPIFDKPNEIALTMNLLLDKDKQLPVGKLFDKEFIKATYTKDGIKYDAIHLDKFKKYLVGSISYYLGPPSSVYPQKKLHIEKVKMSEKQYKLYKEKIIDNPESDVTNEFLFGARIISNIVYPNGKFGKKGYESLKNNMLSVENMKIYSPKFVKILDRLNNSSGTSFIFSSFKNYGGIKPLIKFLKYNGYEDYKKNGIGKKRFAIWSGDENKAYREEIKEIFNNVNNQDGSHIKVIIGSKAAKEGVSFLRIQYVHIVEPYWNFSGMDQIIGRAFRYCSHKDMPLTKRVVYVFIYLAVHPKLNPSVDEHILLMAVKKKELNIKFERAIKEAAIDCKLFENANIEENGKLHCMNTK